MPGKQDVPEVVVALGAQRLPDRGVGAIMDDAAPHGFSVWALLVATHHTVVTADAACAAMDRTEAGRGQRGEYLGTVGHGGGDVVAASSGSCGDELPSVAGVQV
ncbi:Uncharacterised protein [Mycobacteroides abscessus subsp. abscessus]|nr:Uncharacterised protein [Mycobacteroides abscessus subsp. abscessus]